MHGKQVLMNNCLLRKTQRMQKRECVWTRKTPCACFQMIKKKKRCTVLLVCHVVSAQVRTPKHRIMKICMDRTLLCVGVGILCVYQRIFVCGLLCIIGTVLLSCAVETYFCELDDASLAQVCLFVSFSVRKPIRQPKYVKRNSCWVFLMGIPM